jgi:hypothetical protein
MPRPDLETPRPGGVRGARLIAEIRNFDIHIAKHGATRTAQRHVHSITFQALGQIGVA